MELPPNQVFFEILVPNFCFNSCVGAIASLVQFTFSASAIVEQFTFFSIMSFYLAIPYHSCLLSRLILTCSCLLMRCLFGSRSLCCLPCLVCWCLFLFCYSLGFGSLFKGSLLLFLWGLGAVSVLFDAVWLCLLFGSCQL